MDFICVLHIAAATLAATGLSLVLTIIGNSLNKISTHSRVNEEGGGN